MWDTIRKEDFVILLKMTLYNGRKSRNKETVRNFAPSPFCQNKLRIHCLFNSVSSLFLQLLPQEQIGSPSGTTFITYLWVLLITLNVFETHLDFSKCSDNFGQKITKPLVLIQITQTV